MIRLVRSLLIAPLFVFVASCGGGGGGGGSNTAAASGGQQQAAQSAPSVSFSSSESQPEQDDNFDLTWSASAGASCTASGSWSGSKARSGTETYTSSEIGTFEFVLTCSNSAGETAKTVSVTIVEKTYGISGVVRAASFAEVDGDVPSPDYLAIGNNGNEDGVQLIENPAKLVGYVTDVEDGDEFDIYEIGLTGNQWVGLEIADYDSNNPTAVDLDVYIVNEDLEVVSYGISANAFESVALPDSGKFFILVRAITGASRYVLTISNTVNSYRFSSYSSDASVVPDSMIVSRVRDSSDNQNSDRFVEFSKIDREIMRELRIDHRGSDGSEPGREFPSGPFTRLKSMTQNSEWEQIYLNKVMRTLGDRWAPMLTEHDKNQILTKKYIARKAKLVRGIRVEPQMMLRGLSFQKDPLYEYQWNHQNIGLQAALQGLGLDATDQIVAVLDQGSPPKSSANYARTDYVDGGYDFISNDDDPTASVNLSPSVYNTDTHESHGIHVSGIIGAKNDGADLTGMGIKVLPVRVLSEEGNNGTAVSEALKYFSGEPNISGEVYDNSTGNLAALNLSLGACVDETYPFEDYQICQSISKIRDAGISVVVAAGNCDCNGSVAPIYCPVASLPAACPGAISVAAVDAVSERAPYSSYHSTVDIAAPGGDGTADENVDGYPDGVPSYVDLDHIVPLQGTSMAAPHVAGAIALMKHVGPDLTPYDIDALLQSGQLTRGNQSSWSQELGYGLLDLPKSLDAITSSTGSIELTAAPFFSPSEYDYGFTDDSFSLSVKKRGGGSLEVEGIYADIPDHLGYRTETPDETEIARYTFSLKRDEIAIGSIRNSLHFLMTDGNYYSVPLRYSIGELREPPNVGTNLLVVYDLSLEEIVDYAYLDMASGSANFAFSKLPTADYILVAISDIDSSTEGDNWLVGELLALYPDTSSIENGLTLDSDLNDLELSLVPYSELTVGASSTSTQADESSLQRAISNKIGQFLKARQ